MNRQEQFYNELAIFIISLIGGFFLGFLICAKFVAPELNKLRATNKTLLELVEKRMK